MDFNINAARKAGYSDDEIASYLSAQNPKFDFAGAQKAGYSSSEILDHLNGNQQYNGILREPAIAASNLAKGVLDAGGVPGSLAQAENKYIAAPVARTIAPVFGIDPKTVTDDSSAGMVTVPEVEKEATSKGIINRADLQPQNAGERYLGAASRGVGSMAPFGLAGAPGLLAAQGTGTGIAGQAASDAGLSPAAQAAASVAGGVGAGAITNLGTRGLNTLAGNLTPTATAYENAGITPRLAGNISDSPGMKWIQARAAESPMTMSKIKDAASGELDDFRDASEKLASSLGNSQTLQDAGSALQGSFGKWLSNFKTTSSQNWNKVDDLVGKNTPAWMPNTQNVINNMKATASMNPAAQDFLMSPIAKQVDGILSDTSSQQGTNPYSLSSLATDNPITWGTMKQIRSRVGEYLENPSVIADAGGAQAKQIYGALSSDMKNRIMFLPTNFAGRDAAMDAFNNANQYSAAGHDFIDNVGSNIQNVKPEDAARYALSQSKIGGTTLASIRQNLPDAADELAAFKIRDSALAQPGVQNAAGDRISPARFLTELGPQGKLSPEAQSALFPDPDTQSALNNLNSVASSMKDTEALANSSKTASANTMGHVVMGGEAGGATGDARGGGPGALVGGAVGAASPIVAPSALGGITTNPLLLKIMSGAPSAQLSYPSALPVENSVYGNYQAQ